MIGFVGQWSHALAASLFAALALWLARRPKAQKNQTLAFACLAMAVWALAAAMAGLDAWIALSAEHLRNLAWLGFMYSIWRRAPGAAQAKSVAWIYGVLSAIIASSAIIDLTAVMLRDYPRLIDAAFLTSMVLHMTVAAGALVLVHNLYTAASPDARAALRLPLAALAALWLYDLNLYTVSYLARGWAPELIELRGILAALLGPVFALAASRTSSWTFSLSRSMTFQSLSLVGIAAYLAAIVAITSAIELIGGDYVRLAQVSFVFMASIAALLLLPSAVFRAWFRVKLAKHLFQHRYDYRAEWLRFNETLGQPAQGALALEARIVQAIADITESPAGMLIAPGEDGVLTARAHWNWESISPPNQAAMRFTADFFLSTGRVVELDAVRRDETGEDARITPHWMLSEPAAWAIVPLIHFNRLAGLVLLARPALSRTLDWEDFDLLRAAGRQAASYLAESRGQEALSDAQRFDEFNRRFAFIMHDIKNLVSQLSLVARNAERHAENPDFRADMVATLNSSTARMNDLLARLSQHNKARPEALTPVKVGMLADEIAKAKRARHAVVVTGARDASLLADAPRLEQALSHLVQNAIDASPANEPVVIEIAASNAEGRIAICDSGAGMSAAFQREQLFRPFVSSKEGGFGIGAFEARSLVAAMGGRIEVWSREGKGSRFTVHLPLAQRCEPDVAEAA